jgi:hypothetical protein
MKVSLLFLPLVAAVSLPDKATKHWQGICRPNTACTMALEKLFHAKLFYKRKEGITPEEFNQYWAYNHTALVQDFHVRLGVVKYSQVWLAFPG